jgi:putative tryptophan/tyrosine transport system substrate-binding protein
MTARMRRREFMAALGGAAAGPILAPRAALAQQRSALVIGFLHTQSPDGFTDTLRGFRQGLKETGFVESENLTVEYRWAENRFDRLPALAADLVRRRVAVIAAFGSPATAAAKAATRTIPIVFNMADDPVRSGFVASLARPGGNLTGVNFFSAELGAKRLELLREMVPGATRIAALFQPSAGAGTEAVRRDLEPAARAMGLQIQTVDVETSQEINVAFATFARERPDALFVGPGPFLSARRVQLAQLAARHAMPASSSVRQFAEVGGLMSYGSNVADAWRQVGAYIGRILKGAKPSDLPVVQASKFELVINHETARTLGITVPPLLLTIADEVIE